MLSYHQDAVRVIPVGLPQAATVIAYAGIRKTETAAWMCLNSYNAMQVINYILNLERAISH